MRTLGILLSIAVPASAGAGRLASLPLWDDGQAEVAIYEATGERYGSMRQYEVVAIVVKEVFDPERGVKSLDRGSEVLKMNTVLTLPTGVYVYRQMMSLFLRRSDLRPLKLAFSSQEWCGTTFKEWRDRGEASTLETRSYFEDEGDRSDPLAPGAGLVFDDALPLALREDPGPRTLRLVASQLSNRATPPWVVETRAVPAREAVEIETAMGPRAAIEVRIEQAGKTVERVFLAPEAPHECLRWERASGHVWSLKRLRRLAYWRYRQPGDEKVLQ